MTYMGLREWEWMIRTAAPEVPDDVERDIWENSRSGRNPAAEDWLNNRVQYVRPSTSRRPTDWRGIEEGDIPYDVQDREHNRSIDDDHEAFERALYRGGLSEPDYSQFSLTGPPPEEYEPTSDERLRSDEGWLLGPGKHFKYPEGRAAIEATHNGMHQRGFDLHNIGTEEDPVPAYVHRETGARISPIQHSDGSAGWQMKSPGGLSEHGTAASAATAHVQKVQEQAAAEAERWSRHQQAVAEDERRWQEDRDNEQRSQRRAPSSTRRRESFDYIPKTKAQGMSWGRLFDEAIHGNEGHGREFERASVKSVHNPSRLATGRLYGVHQDQWNQDFANDAAGRGKVAQAIYHYETPIAWKYHSVQPDGTYDEGTWRYPATNFGSAGFFSTGRVQSLLGPSLWRGNYTHTRDPLVDINLHRTMEEGGLHRNPENQTYSGVDAHGNTHHIAPSQSGRTAVHTVTSQNGDQQFTKRVPAHEAGMNAFDMMRGVSDPASYLRSKNYRQTAGAPPTNPRRRREVPLRLQPELPFRNSSVASWSNFLRDEE